MRLDVAEGIVHRAQDAAALARINSVYNGLDSLTLAALGIAVPAMGSAVLGLALASGVLDAAAAYAVSSLDELFQMEQWGEDVEAAHRRQQVQADLALAERFIQLAR